jgi:hypothetical protein
MKRIITLSIISFLALSFYTGRTQTVVFSSGFESWNTSKALISTVSFNISRRTAVLMHANLKTAQQAAKDWQLQIFQ